MFQVCETTLLLFAYFVFLLIPKMQNEHTDASVIKFVLLYCFLISTLSQPYSLLCQLTPNEGTVKLFSLFTILMTF